MKRCLLLLALFVSIGIYGYGEAPWFSAGADSRIGTTFTKDPRFPVKPQTDIGIAATLEFLPFEFLGLGSSFGYQWTKDSNLEGGFLYRAYSGIDFRIFFSSRFLTIVDGKTIRLQLGSNQGVLMRLDHYDLTTLHFFYWGLFLHPFLEMGFREIPLLAVQFTLPFDYYLRKDLDLSTSIGIGVNLRLYPLRKKWD